MKELSLTLSSDSNEALNQQSSPEDENPASFHTPLHHDLQRSVIASQDSIDIFHDASSNFVPLQEDSSTTLPPSVELPQRRRHSSFSSGVRSRKRTSEDEHFEDCNETTRMLQNGLENQRRVRHWSSGGQGGSVGTTAGTGSRSCSNSPFHVGRLSLSTHSLKRVLERGLSNTPNLCFITMTESKFPGYVPCVEVDNINAEKAAVKRTEFSGSAEGKLHDGRHHKWMSNYVACVEMSKHLNGSVDKNHKIHQFEECKDIENIPTCDQNSVIEKGCCHSLKNEFRASSLSLNHSSPHLFVTSQWQHPFKMSCTYLGYRLFWCTYFVMWGIWSFLGWRGYDKPLREKGGYFVFIYNWNIWLLALDTLIRAVNVISHMRKLSKDGEARYVMMKPVMKLSWALSNITSVTHLLTAIVFWSFTYRHHSAPINEIVINLHVVPCIYILLDACISATPRRLLHAYFPMMFSLIYVSFTFLYYNLMEGKGEPSENYPFIDWLNYRQTLVSCAYALLVVIPLLHFSICGVYAIRMILWRKHCLSRRQKKFSARKRPGAVEEEV